MPPPPPPPPSGPPGRGSQEAAGTGRGGEAPTGPGFPQPLPERGGGTPGPDPADGQGLFACSWDMGGGGRGGGVSPHIPLPPAPPLWGNFPTKKARGRGAFLGWKFPADPLLENKRIFCGPETSGRGINASPSHFSKRNHPQMKAKHCGYFCGFVYFVFNESGRGRHRDNFFFYEGENLIFPDFVAGGGGGGGQPSSPSC